MSQGQQTELLMEDITFQIIAAAYEVHNVLGSGFLEKVYESALENELKLRGLEVEVQKEITVNYKGEKVGVYFADVLVNKEVILELKAAEAISKSHEAQLLNYLKATGKRVGLLINFGKERVDHKRMVL